MKTVTNKFFMLPIDLPNVPLFKERGVDVMEQAVIP